MFVPIIYKPSSSIGFWRTPLPRLSLQRFEEDEDVSRWRGFLSSVGLSLPGSLCRLASPALRLGQRRMLQGKAPDIPEHVLRLAGVGPDKLRSEWSLPAFVAMFLPEFPHKTVPGHEHFQVDPDSGTNILFSLSLHLSFIFYFFGPFWLIYISACPSLPLCVYQVLSYIAKGSFGPILKVKDKAKQKTYAVKVSPLPESCVVTDYHFINITYSK